ncbi:hypothetical protein pEaSNUABM28_00216 [Erwinia phage pEa_SNUABM_28]|uniref:Uncharacterized protein n=2 Tax=Alexandravirus TaxID=2733088 RepID=A0AAE9BV07_9CAUD|nr:hypothetical protein MPK63_gp213 [Erwinia phage pEa_SNUABM_22]YP_010299975.1 hypothetical protein MPK64_gp214 [Erwinia phage pEa_SNUABM_16]QZE58773.1 hypothetical protein pEaSNUABM28_00216 [Erwinia phage pEa_SNUABM_28]QZE59117.1 hypothetical protein pEaSNUABM18_00214 [Erwinia phage pEa_SNUABM_18]UAW96358.1 hypothetical protein pEaSNUABM16_00214 [Erwinia phage pEa_SNUABM_16]UAW96701.1 hypothetical protein pEaSNUABM22_00214 [Erwinia phage pEa_SNUABM_22]
MLRKPSYRVVADLIEADGTFTTHCVESGIKDYDVVEKKLESIKQNPPSHFKQFFRVVPRWEMSFA